MSTPSPSNRSRLSTTIQHNTPTTRPHRPAGNKPPIVAPTPGGTLTPRSHPLTDFRPRRLIMENNPYRQSEQDPQQPPLDLRNETPNYAPYPQHNQGMSTGAKVAIGCGVAALVVTLAIGIGIWYVMTNLKGIVSDLATGVITQAVNDSNIPADQKQRINARLNQLNTDFKDGKVTTDQIAAIAEALMEGPVLPIGTVLFVDSQYIQPSALTDQEKADGRQSLERLARGVFDKFINPDKLEPVMEPITEPDPTDPTSRQLKPNPTTEELREFLKRAKAEADTANVPDEPWTIDLADEVDKAIDQVLNPSAGP